MKARRCIPCVALVLALTCAAFAAHASDGPLSSVSSDGLMALVGTVLFSLLAGYAKGQERRMTLIEQQQRQVESQIALFRDTVLERHPSRHEMDQLREDMREGFSEVKRLIREAH